MYRLFFVFVLFIFYVTVLQFMTVAAEPLDVLLDNVVERSGLIQSGVFRFTTYSPSNDNTVINSNVELETCKFGLKILYKDLAICFRGNEWTHHRNQITFDNPHIIVKDNYQAEYDEIPRSNGTIGKLYYVTPKHSDISDLLSPSYAFLVAGRLPSDLLCDYIRDHKGEAKDMGIVTLANGDVTRHVQFVIPKKYYSYVRIYMVSGGDDIYNFDSMILNLYVMPEKGYVLRRIDECNPNGKVKMRWESLDFVDRGNGIFFPNVFMSISVCEGNRERTMRHEMKEVLFVNEPIPDAYFDRKLSKGTTIRDWRYSSVDENGDPRFFATLRDGMASEIDEFYNEWFAEQEKKKKIKESQKDNPISALPVDIDTKIMENLPPIANKDKANNFFYHIVISLFFCIAIVVVILFSIRKKKNTK